MPHESNAEKQRIAALTELLARPMVVDMDPGNEDDMVQLAKEISKIGYSGEEIISGWGSKKIGEVLGVRGPAALKRAMDELGEGGKVVGGFQTIDTSSGDKWLWDEKKEMYVLGSGFKKIELDRNGVDGLLWPVQKLMRDQKVTVPGELEKICSTMDPAVLKGLTTSGTPLNDYVKNKIPSDILERMSVLASRL